MKKPHQIKIFQDKLIMNGISDKKVILIIFLTILFVFGLIFSVKSPERKVIDSPIMWKDDYINSSTNKMNSKYHSDFAKYSS